MVRAERRVTSVASARLYYHTKKERAMSLLLIILILLIVFGGGIGWNYGGPHYGIGIPGVLIVVVVVYLLLGHRL